MDALSRLEIFIPLEAEVKSVPLGSLPRAVRKRIDLRPPSGPPGPPGPPEGTWISPVVLRRRGQRGVPRSVENLSSVLSSQARSLQAPLEMSIVSPNRAAYSVLRGAVPGRLTPGPSGALRAAVPPGCRGAVVIYRGNIYLSMKKESGRPRSKPAAQSTPTSSSVVSSTSQRKEELRDSRPVEQHSSPAAEPPPKEALPQEELAVSDGEEARSHSYEAKGGSRGQSLGPGTTAAASPPQYDFKSLAEQEIIAQKKAKLQAFAKKLEN
ncbi:uncharacterized protein LOC115408881 [Salarias fasciatus]|uniref:uncharacterized protein LOC115408881 n=1 Tax=Salarias fasciatus TaxID=181472 RepID=UPI001176EED8|nr:uncharacterized protein LOC115408881 [Salarias fasciatus]